MPAGKTARGGPVERVVRRQHLRDRVRHLPRQRRRQLVTVHRGRRHGRRDEDGASGSYPVTTHTNRRGPLTLSSSDGTQRTFTETLLAIDFLQRQQRGTRKL